MELNKLLPKKNNKITRIRPSKKEYYKEEQEEIIKKINDIIGINESNNVIYLYDIETDKGIYNKILLLIDDIKKYFTCSKWGFFRQPDSTVFALIRILYKTMNYQIVAKPVLIDVNDKKVRTTKYVITKFNVISAK